MNSAEKALSAILRILGVIVLMSVFAIVMPKSCMEATNRWLGLGELPDMPIIGYLARSLSVMYAMHGALMVYLSLDVRRYAALLRFFAAIGVVFGITLLVLDLAVQMPWWWTLGEGPFVILSYIAIFVLATGVEQRRLRSEAAPADSARHGN